MNNWQTSLFIALVASLASVGLNAWTGRSYHSRHPAGRRGYLIDCALGGVSFFVLMSGMMVAMTQGLGWKGYLAAVAWAVAIIAAFQMLAPFRNAQKRLIQTRLASR